MKSVFSFVALLLLSSLSWAQNINSPANITANQVSIPNATTYSSGTVVNQFTGGVNPNPDPSIWDNSPYRIGGHLGKVTQDDTGNGSSDEFNLDVESYADPTGSTVTNCVETPSNVVTLSATNSFSSGLRIGVNGLTHCTWLNYQFFTVTSATGSTVVFTDTTGHGSSVSHSDTGKVGPAAFKGPIFVSVYDNDGFWDSPEAYTYYTHVVTGNTTAYAEGLVGQVDTQGTGDGYLIGIEDDISNNGSDVNGSNPLGGCRFPSNKCKVNLFLGSGGTYPQSWAILVGNGGPGFHNGINLSGSGSGDGVLSGGEAIVIPNNTYIDARNAANTGDMIMMSLNSSNNIVLGSAGAGNTVYSAVPLAVAVGGSANHLICWKSDGKTLGYCSNDPGSGNGTCTCN